MYVLRKELAIKNRGHSQLKQARRNYIVSFKSHTLKIGLCYPLNKNPIDFGFPEDVFWVRQTPDLAKLQMQTSLFSEGFGEAEMLLTEYRNEDKQYISWYCASQAALWVKNLPADTGDERDAGSTPGREDPLEEEMTTHASILAWKIP